VDRAALPFRTPGKVSLWLSAEGAVLVTCRTFYGVARQVIQGDASVIPPSKRDFGVMPGRSRRSSLRLRGSATAWLTRLPILLGIELSPFVKDVAI